MARVLNNRRRCILGSPGGDTFSLPSSNQLNAIGKSLIFMRTLVLQKACKIENKYWVLGSLTWTFPPISNDFDNQGLAASRAVYIIHMGFTASDSGSTAKCRVPACILRPAPLSYVTLAGFEINARPLPRGDWKPRGMSRIFAQVVRRASGYFNLFCQLCVTMNETNYWNLTRMSINEPVVSSNMMDCPTLFWR